MSDEMKSELYFLIAKFIRKDFPEFGEKFIEECEKKHLFPSRVFATNPSFNHLDQKVITGIPDDQILNLIRLACPKSQSPSLFFSKNESSISPNIADVLINNLGVPTDKYSEFRHTRRSVGHFLSIFCLAIDKTSQILITGSDDSIIKIWKIPGLILLKPIKNHDEEVTDISIHPSNKFFLSTSYDHSFAITSLVTGDVLCKKKLEDKIHTGKFSPCGRYFAVACDKGFVNVYYADYSDFPLHFTIRIRDNNSPTWLSFSPGGTFLSICADPDLLMIVNVEYKQVIYLEGHSDSPDHVSFSKFTPKILLSYSKKEKQVRYWQAKNDIWSPGTLFELKKLTGVKYKVSQCCWSCDESILYAITKNYLFAWDQLGNCIFCETHEIFEEECSCLAPHPINPYLIYVGTSTGDGLIWCVKTKEIISFFLMNRNGKINDAQWSPDGQYLYTVDRFGGITEYANCKDQFFSSEMFFLGELDPDYNLNDTDCDKEKVKIVDTEAKPLDPQPYPWRLSDISIGCKVVKSSSYIIKSENELKQHWKSAFAASVSTNKSDISKINEIEEEYEYSSEDHSVNYGSDVEDSEEINESFGEGYNAPVSRMRTRLQVELANQPRRTRSQRELSPTNKSKSNRTRANQTRVSEQNSAESRNRSKTQNTTLSQTRSRPNRDNSVSVKSRYRNDSPSQTRTKTQKQNQESTGRDHQNTYSNSMQTRTRKPKEFPKPLTSIMTRSRSHIAETSADEEYHDDDILSESDVKKSNVSRKKEIELSIPVHVTTCSTLYKDFVPQKGEEVVFIQEAYNIYIQNNIISTKNPRDVDPSLPDIWFGKVKQIQYSETGTLCFIETRHNKLPITLEIFCPYPHGEFLISRSRYNESIGFCRRLRIGDTVDCIVFIQNKLEDLLNCEVTEQLPPTPTVSFGSLGVKCEDIHYDISPWNLQNLQNRNKYSKALLEFSKTIESYMDKYRPLVQSHHGVQAANHYIKTKKCISLSVIFDRCQNSWYRSIESLFEDIKDLCAIKSSSMTNKNREELTKTLKDDLFKLCMSHDFTPPPGVRKY